MEGVLINLNAEFLKEHKSVIESVTMKMLRTSHKPETMRAERMAVNKQFKSLPITPFS